jgi:hypothetical protein
MPREAEDAALAFILQLDPATQREVLERFEEVLQLEPDSVARRLRRVAAALHGAKRLLGRSPSVRDYKTLRRSHPERGWPDPRSITRWLGVRSWNDALVRMRLEPLLEGDVVEGSIGQTYSIDEVIQAVRDCANDLGRPRPSPTTSPGSTAPTYKTGRVVGPLGPGCSTESSVDSASEVAAGLVEGEPTAAHPSDLILRTANYRIGDTQILEDLRFAATRIAGPVTATAYDRERRLIYQETRAKGSPRALAGVGTIYRHFRTWGNAVHEAGLHERESTEARRAVRGLNQPVFSKNALLQALSEAYDAVGPRLTLAAYLEWRERESARDPHRRSELPGSVTVYRRLGGWQKAVREMQKWRRNQ